MEALEDARAAAGVDSGRTGRDAVGPGDASLPSRAAASPRHRLLLRAQVVVGFGIFGIMATTYTGLLPLVWLACLGRRGTFARVSRVAVRLCFASVFRYLPLLGFMRLERRVLAEPGRPCLLACNHVSLFDVLAVIVTVPHCFTFVKASFVRIPIIRYIIQACGFVPVDPRDPAQSAEAFSRALALLDRGEAFVVFPEGTRSRDGSLGPFQKGAFRLSRLSGVPLTPVEFRSTGPLLNKDVMKLPDGKPVTLRMTLHPVGAHLGAEGAGTVEDEMRALRAFFEERRADSHETREDADAPRA